MYLPSVIIVILNWNGWKDTLECLESVYQIKYPNYEIIVVDNDSKDNSIEKIREYAQGKLYVRSKFFKYCSGNKPIKITCYTKDEIVNEVCKEKIRNYHVSPGELTVIKNDRNDGFAEGNNIGMRFAIDYSNPDYILLLNNDTVVEKDFLNELVNFAESDQNIGVLGPKVCYYDNPNIINSAGAKFEPHLSHANPVGLGEKDEGQFNEVLEVDCLLGACLLVRVPLLKEIGLLDKKFFLLLEDTEFCIRANKADYRVIFNPNSQIYHKEGVSGELSPLSLYYSSRNKLFILKKHQTFMRMIFYLSLISMEYLFYLVVYGTKGDTESMKTIIRGYFDGLTN